MKGDAIMASFTAKIQTLVGHIQRLRHSGMCKRQIRDDEVVNNMLNRIFDIAWETCVKADEKRKEMEKSDI